jgi:hypothetical protein
VGAGHVTVDTPRVEVLTVPSGSPSIGLVTDTELPAVPDRVDPPFVAGERAMLESWLDFHRATLLRSATGSPTSSSGSARSRRPPSACSGSCGT